MWSTGCPPPLLLGLGVAPVTPDKRRSPPRHCASRRVGHQPRRPCIRFTISSISINTTTTAATTTTTTTVVVVALCGVRRAALVRARPGAGRSRRGACAVCTAGRARPSVVTCAASSAQRGVPACAGAVGVLLSGLSGPKRALQARRHLEKIPQA
eukprot:scaffold3713_cov372-Prasinococcus_capsulatus_cf.AAC.26